MLEPYIGDHFRLLTAREEFPIRLIHFRQNFRYWAAMNRGADADAVMDKAIKHPTATVQLIHQYGRTPLQAENTKSGGGFQQRKIPPRG